MSSIIKKSRIGVPILLTLWAILFWIGTYFLQYGSWEYRYSFDVLGKLNTFWLLPTFCCILILTRKRERSRRNEVWYFLAWVGAGILSLCLFLISFFLIVLTTNDEYRVSSKTLLVDQGEYSVGDHYSIYKPVYAVFRQPGKWNEEAELCYLREKYGREFSGDGKENGKVFLTENKGVAVYLSIMGHDIQDDFPRKYAAEKLKEGYQSLGIKRGYQEIESCFYLQCNGEADIEAFCEDAARLMAYVKQDKIYEKYWGYFGYEIVEEDTYQGKIAFGGKGDTSSDYEELLETMKQAYQEAVDEWQYRKTTQEITERLEAEAAEEGETEEAVDPFYMEIEAFAKEVYEQVFAKDGGSYDVCYNAKGNLYLDLGDDRTLVYDRESKNKKCQLYVAYQGSGDAISILNFYAVERETGKVIAGDKKAWADLGSKEYREATGE